MNSIESRQVFGDIEMVMGLNSYHTSLICIEKTEVYSLTQKNYERLINRKNPSTFETLKFRSLCVTSRTFMVQFQC